MPDENKIDAPVITDNANDPLKSGNDTPPVSSGTKVDALTNDSHPTDKKGEPTKVFDAQKDFEALRTEFDKTSKSYKELRRESTRWSQERAELQKQLDSLGELLTKATETPVDPVQFLRDLQTQGPKALEPHFQKWSKPMVEKYEKAIAERDSSLFQIQRDFALERRRNDGTNYPDFKKLEDTMREIAEDEKCPVDFNQHPDAIYDALYKLARDRNAEQAVKLAKEQGKKEKELELAKEANASIASGGKSGGSQIPNFDKMSAEKMREVVAQLHGIADRD